MIGIRIVGLALGMPSPHDGRWLAYYDPTKNGFHGDIRTTDDPAKALAFPNLVEASACWRQAHGTRPDGRPNRPLSAFTVTIEHLPPTENPAP